MKNNSGNGVDTANSVVYTSTNTYGRVTKVKTTTKEYVNDKLVKETVVETEYTNDWSYPTYPTYPQPYNPYPYNPIWVSSKVLPATTASARVEN